MKDFKEKRAINFLNFMLLIVFLSSVLVIYTRIKFQTKKHKEFQIAQNKKFDEIIFKRALEENTEKSFSDSTSEICQRGSEELNDYYKNGDETKIDLSKIKLKDEKDQPEYIQKIIDFIDEDAEIVDVAKSYITHALPSIIFLCVGVLSIIVWIVFWFCCCCNCCCCCCCKRSCCKYPCFILAFVFIGISIVISIYALAKSNIIFKDLANSECSILQFLNSIRKGEEKSEFPKWIGFERTHELFNDLKENAKKIGDEVIKDLKKSYSNLDIPKERLNNNFTMSWKDIIKDSILLETDSGKYIVESAKNIGPSSDTNTFLYALYFEFTAITNSADEYLTIASSNIESLSKDTITNTLEPAEEGLEVFEDTINDIKDQISDFILDYSIEIDDYGKLGFKILFSFIILIDVAIFVFLLLLCFCGFQECNNCCCCRCFLKFFIHILWNILSLLMILSFILGGVFTLIGTIGKDLYSVVSFYLGEENLGLGENSRLIGGAAEYLNPCIHGNGDLMKALELSNDITNQLQELKNLTEIIKNAKTSFAIQKPVSLDNEIKKIRLEKEDTSKVKFYSTDTLVECTTCDDLSFRDIAKKQLEIIENFLIGLNSTYIEVLTTEEDILNLFDGNISKITDVFDNYVGEDNQAFDFLNCKFVEKNFRVILKYLSEELGDDFHIVGIFIVFSACSMGLAISFIILEVIIINTSVEENIKNAKKTEEINKRKEYDGRRSDDSGLQFKPDQKNNIFQK